MVPDKKYYTIYTSNDFSVNFMFILHVAKRNVQLYMPNLNGLAKSTGNVNCKYSPIYLGIRLFLQNEKRGSLKCTSLRRKTL